MSKKTVLITGGNRGIGLALTEAMSKDGYKVIATTRNKKASPELAALAAAPEGQVIIMEVDVTSDASVQKLCQSLKDGKHSIDILVNNAGIAEDFEEPLSELPLEKVTRTFEVNVLGPIRVTKAMLPLLSKSSRTIIANISSKMGSIADNSTGKSYGYRISKAALNMFTKNLSTELTDTISVTLHPGWVQTRMGGPRAPTQAADSASGILKVIKQLKPKDSGRFLDFKGAEIPW